MAQIIPANTDLGDVQEGTAVDVEFTAQFDVNEGLVSINIIDYQPTPGINVSGARYSGTYESVFALGQDSLLYRDGDEFKSTSSWNDLPPAETVDLYLWRAPGDLRRTFTYTVELVYWAETETGGGDSGSSTTVKTESTITKTYSQLVFGNWSLWANQLRAYVYARG